MCKLINLEYNECQKTVGFMIGEAVKLKELSEFCISNSTIYQ